jgi:hypothetical protein
VLNFPSLAAITLAVVAYGLALNFRQWAAAVLATVTMAAFTFLGGCTPWGGLYLVGLIPVGCWYWLDVRPAKHMRSKASLPPVQEIIFGTGPSCSCPACQGEGTL